MSELLDGTGHPRHFEYAQCARCGTWRPEQLLAYSAADSARYLAWLKDAIHGDGTEPEMGPAACSDVAWCGKQAGVGLGQLDVPKERP